MKRNHPTQAYRLLATLGVLAVLFYAARPAQAADSTDPATSKRWEYRDEGLSLLPPAGTELHAIIQGDALLRIDHPSDYKITLYIKRSAQDLTLDQVVQTAVQQVATSPRLVRKVQEPTNITIGPLKGQVFSYAIPEAQPPILLVQAFAMLNPHTVLMLELNANPQHYDASRAAFDRVLASVQVEDPKKLAQKRQAEILAGKKWLQATSVEAIHQQVIPQQWFRILDKRGTDIGYMRINQKTDTVLRQNGIQIDIQSRLVLNGVPYDTISNYFASDTQKDLPRTEVWSVRTTARPQANATKEANETTWAETGILSKGTLSVTKQSPQDNTPLEWGQLPDGYTPQAYSRLIPMWLKSSDLQPMAFYVYNAKASQVGLCTIQVKTGKNGSYQVHTRTNPDQEEEISYFDASGKLLKQVLPDGQTLLPSTADQIIARWKLKS